MNDASNIVKGNFQRKEDFSTPAKVSTGQRPAPFVPVNYESRKLMKLYLDRDDVLDATEAALLDGDLMPIWITRMIAVAWKEKIPGSLPNDDVKLARLICGGNNAQWLALKDQLLADWIECDNGRLYNQGVAEAIGLSIKEYNQRAEAAAKGREAKARKRAEKDKLLENQNNFSAENSAENSDAVTSRHVTSRHS